ncbi:MAG: CbiX/SirB N-terminal domain-containing protein [Pseudomonadota bacterium]
MSALPEPTKRGLLLFAHGARDPGWAAPFEAVASQLRGLRPDAEVRLAFLEFMSPTLPEAAADMVAAGCAQVDVVPLFLGAGGHVRKDVPQLMAQLRTAHPTIGFALHPAIGEHDAVIAAMATAAASLTQQP